MTVFLRRAPETLTFVDVLRDRAQRRPERQALTFLADGETESERLTFGDVDARAHDVAALLGLHHKPGDRVLLLLPPGLDFAVAFLGCLYSGAVAVPSPAPMSSRALTRIEAIIEDCRPSIVLTNRDVLDKIGDARTTNPQLARPVWRVIEDAESPGPEAPGQPAPGDLAFLQYTSGSTSSPKGVMVTHGNLLANMRMIAEATGHSNDTPMLSWLPVYHDMGLIGCLLQPLYLGTEAVLMPPIRFIQNPIRWLRAITRYRPHTSGGPNFAYDLCVDRTTDEERQGLDLSSWRVAFNGAEPVRADTLAAFAATFAEHGFRAEIHYPNYGLAEGTLIVAGGRKTELPVVRRYDGAALERNEALPATIDAPDARSLVSSGRTIQDQRIIIVDPDTRRRLDDRRIGEIWVTGDNVARGYWGRPEATFETFGARLAGDPDDGPFLRTGDLGFLDDRELFVTGRLKDMIIIRGRNIYPHDVELTAERAHAVLAAAGGAAFAVEEDGEERLVLVHELTRHFRKHDLSEVSAAVRAAVLAEFEVPLARLYLTKPGRAPKTSSGKIMRHAVRGAFQEGALDEVWADVADPRPVIAGPVAVVAESEDVPGLLRAELAAALGVEPAQLDVGLPLHAHGLDSLAAAALAQRIETRLGVDVPMTTFMQDRSLEDLAADLRRQRRAGGRKPAAPMPQKCDDETRRWFPLTRGQRALWFQQHLAQDASAYNVNLTVDLRGPLDEAALRRALESLAERHELLRLRLIRRHGEPAWESAPPVPGTPPLGLTEVVLDPAMAEDDVLRRIVADAHHPFPLTGAPVARAFLYRHGERRLLVFCLHHIICDGWSMNVLFEDLRALYESARGGPFVASPVRPYVEYLSGQEALLAGPRGTLDLAYWRRHLGGLPPILTLPVARPRPPVQNFAGGSVPVNVPPALEERLGGVAADLGVTRFVVLLAVFQILLRRYSRTETFAIGTVSSGRTRPGFEHTFGYFVNPLTLRAEVADDLAFAAFARQVRGDLLYALDHQELPFSVLVEQLNPVRDPSGAPLFQIAFGLTDVRDGATAGDLSLRPLVLAQQEGQFDLNLEFFRFGDRLHGTLNYASDLFDADVAAHMADHYLQLLADAVNRPDTPIASLDMIPRPARSTLLAWSSGGVDPADQADDGRLVHQLIADRARATPEAPAVQSADGLDATVLTYRELDRQATLLAHVLRAHGVGRDSVVGVFLPRAPSMVVAVLAVLKAGGAYLPLDPTYPREHLAVLIEDGAPRVILAEDSLLDRLPGNVAGRAVVVRLSEFPAVGDPAPLEERADPDSLAYVIFTSGSTGRPKGVMMPHRSVVPRLMWKVRTLDIGSDDCLLQSIPLSFDPSVWELFAPLVAGARLVLPRGGIQQDPSEMVAAMRRHRITLISCVPSLLVHLCDQPELGDCTALRHVICGGESLSGEVANLFRDRNRARLHHFYGPTEAAIFATHWPCDDDRTGSLPIGRPVAGAQVHVVDEALRPQPDGVPGELVIGGIGLARGYLGDGGSDDRGFVADPFDVSGAGRLYRTGDLAMWRPDGTLQFLGRLDSQVKVRGFRVETSAVEAKLRDHPAVAEAVVTVHPPSGGEGSLAAYVVAADSAVGRAALRAFLGERLPAYMVPSFIIAMDALPLLPNGKVDLAALPEPTGVEDRRAAAYVPPATEIERVLVRIWEEVLQRRRIGLRDNFLEMGGHSLVALRLVARIQEELGQRISPTAVMQTPTIEALAMELQKAEQGAHGHIVQVRAGGQGTPVFYVAPGHGDLVSFSVLGRRIDTMQPFFALVPPREPGQSLHVEIGRLARRYAEEMRNILPNGPYQLVGFSLGGVVALEVARLLRAEGRPVAPVVLLDTFFPYLPRFSHAVFKLVRAVVLSLGKPAERWFKRPLKQIFTDQGLIAQVEAMCRFKPAGYDGAAVLIMSTTARRLRFLLFRPWRRLLPNLTMTAPVSGWHDQMFQDPHIAELARILRPLLSAAEQAPDGDRSLPANPQGGSPRAQIALTRAAGGREQDHPDGLQ